MLAASLWESATTAALVTGGFGLGFIAVNFIVSSIRENRNRRRDVFAKALQACARYEEMPYVIRRRRASDAEGERIRISEEMRKTQEDLTFYEAWMSSESRHVAERYAELVARTRDVAGKQLHEAWLVPAMASDEDMSMPDLGLAVLDQPRKAYLLAVAKCLSPVRSRFRARRAPRDSLQ